MFDVITISPRFFSKSSLADLAACTPSFAIFLFSSSPSGLCFLASSYVAASPKSARITSILDILSLKFSFRIPLYSLYCFAFIPDHSSYIVLVNIAYSTPSLMPLLFHTLVNSLNGSAFGLGIYSINLNIHSVSNVSVCLNLPS